VRARATLYVAAVFISASLVGAQPPSRSAAAPALRIADVTVIDGTGAPPRPHTDVVVRDGVIADVGPTTSDRTEVALTVNGSGRVLIPGLFDAHVHLSGMPWDQRVPQLKRVLTTASRRCGTWPATYVRPLISREPSSRMKSHRRRSNTRR